MARTLFGGKAVVWPSSWRINLGTAKSNKIKYYGINGSENLKKSTKPHKTLRLGEKKTFRKRLRSVRVHVSKKLRIRIKLSPRKWLRKLCDGYVNMMLRVSEEIADSGCLISGLHFMSHVHPGIA